MASGKSVAVVVLVLLAASTMPVQAESFADANIAWFLETYFPEGHPDMDEVVTMERDGAAVSTTFGAVLQEFGAWSSRGDLRAMTAGAGLPPSGEPIVGDIAYVGVAERCPEVETLAPGPGEDFETPLLTLHAHDIQEVHAYSVVPSIWVVNYVTREAYMVDEFHIPAAAVEHDCVHWFLANFWGATNGPMWLTP